MLAFQLGQQEIHSPILLRYDSVTGQVIPKISRIIAPLCSKLSCPSLFLDFWENQGTTILESSETTHPMTQCYTPEDSIRQDMLQQQTTMLSPLLIPPLTCLT
jgi:hypothetical protein